MKLNQELRKKAINIKGKEYVLVSDRVLAFNEKHEKANIETSYEYISELNMFIVKAKITTERGVFTGLSQAVIGDGYINKTSALENCETSAVGRALGIMGIGVLDSIASVDEINKAGNNVIKKKTTIEMILDKIKIADDKKLEVIKEKIEEMELTEQQLAVIKKAIEKRYAEILIV